VTFSEQPPSKQWAALLYRGEPFAEVWFKPEGQPLALTFRVPQTSFQLPGLDERLTMGNLLRAVGIGAEEVESWRDAGQPTYGTNGVGLELRRPLSPPPPDVAHLNLFVTLKPPPASAPDEGPVPEIQEATWQFLADRWNLILGLEASVDSLRITMEGLRSEMEAAARKTLPLEVKVNALSADVVQWDKAKSRIRYAVPKVRESIHRSIWATGSAERKKLAELFETHIQPRVPFPRVEDVMAQLEGLLKDRQTLYAQGMSVYQDCKRICGECQGTLRALEGNAAANARRKKR
jgi:hypothetical protein